MKIGITTHDFVKQNMVTIMRGKKAYDKVKCRICGLEGIRYGLSDNISVKRDKKCTKRLSRRVEVISQYVCDNFGFERGKIYDRIDCPDECKDKYLDGFWVYSDARKEPVRLLHGEFILHD